MEVSGGFEPTLMMPCLIMHASFGAMVTQAYLQTGIRRLSARSHFTDSRLFDQLALAVIVGDSGGDACSTTLGALGPGRGLDDALLTVKHLDFRLWSECCD